MKSLCATKLVTFDIVIGHEINFIAEFYTATGENERDDYKEV